MEAEKRNTVIEQMTDTHALAIVFTSVAASVPGIPGPQMAAFLGSFQKIENRLMSIIDFAIDLTEDETKAVQANAVVRSHELSASFTEFHAVHVAVRESAGAIKQ